MSERKVRVLNKMKILIDDFKMEVEGKLTDEILEKEYPLFEKDTQWQLTKGAIAKEQDFKINL